MKKRRGESLINFKTEGVVRMEKVHLCDIEIELLINGSSIQKTLSDGTVISISQSLMKDMLAPMVNHDKKVFSNAEIENIKIASSMMVDTFKLGY